MADLDLDLAKDIGNDAFLTLSDLGIIVSICLGLYAAILSTFNLIVQRREKVRRLRVSIERGSSASTDGSQESEEQVKMEAANTGNQKVTLAGVWIQCYGNRGLTTRYFMLFNSSGIEHASLQATRHFPYELEPGKNFQNVIRLSAIHEALKASNQQDAVKIRACYSDQTGKDFVSKWLSIDLP